MDLRNISDFDKAAEPGNEAYRMALLSPINVNIKMGKFMSPAPISNPRGRKN
jgi:hypothetical protein